LILSKITKTVATSHQILRQKFNKFDFGRLGSATDPAGGAYSTPKTSWLDLRGPPQNVALIILTPQSKNKKIVPAYLYFLSAFLCFYVGVFLCNYFFLLFYGPSCLN